MYTPDRLEQDETEYNNECNFCGMPCEHIFCNKDCATANRED